METFELRYFLGVAKLQNIRKASEELHVSPGSLSKAINRLEEELSVKLFSREGRNIRLTDHGRLLQSRASEIIRIEESTKLELAGEKGTIKIHISGPEILLANWGFKFCEEIRDDFPLTEFEFHACDDEAAIEAVKRGEAHIAIVSSDIPKGNSLCFKNIGETAFKTFVSRTHLLYSKRKNIDVKALCQHAFASPNHPLLGKVGFKQSLDGWRDDQFPRKIQYLTSSLKILEEIVTAGKAIAYLPEYLGKKLNLEILTVSGCPYTCKQKIKIVTRDPKELSWLKW